MKKSLFNILLCLSFQLLLATPILAQSQKMKTYTNETRAFVVDYPANFKISAPSTSDDGRSFTPPDGKGVIYATSGTEAQVESMQINDVYQYYLKEYGAKVTYKSRKANWFVISGKNNDGTIFYLRCFYNSDLSAYRKLLFEYPAAQSGTFDKLIPKMVASFKDL